MKALLAGSRKRKGTECNFKAEGFNNMRYKVYLELKAYRRTFQIPEGRDTGSVRVKNSARLANIKTSAPPAQEEMAYFHFFQEYSLFKNLFY